MSTKLLVTFTVTLPNRPNFITHSHLLMRAMGDLHPFHGGAAILSVPGQPWPRPGTRDHAEHRAVRRAALLWNRAYFSLERLAKEVGPQERPHLYDPLISAQAQLRVVRMELLRQVMDANKESASLPLTSLSDYR